MELIDRLREKIVCLDTSPLIYYIEKHPKYINALRPLFSEISSGGLIGFTSTISLLEVMVLPLRRGNIALAEKYKEIMLYSDNFTVYEISNDISELAARIRAKYEIRTPDALQIATGVFKKANIFLTNDSRLKKIEEIGILLVEETLKA